MPRLRHRLTVAGLPIETEVTLSRCMRCGRVGERSAKVCGRSLGSIWTRCGGSTELVTFVDRDSRKQASDA